MDVNHLVPASFDDILFENRNKAYGAYQLRREYNDRMKKATGISLSGVLLLFAFGYAAIQLRPNPVEDLLSRPIDVVVELQPQPVLEEVKPPQTPAAPASAAPVTATRQFTEPKIVDEQQPVAAEIPSQTDFAQADPGLATTTGIASAGSIGEATAPAGDGAGEEIQKPFDFVEQMPEYADGGQAAMLKFISKHLHYPHRAVAEGLEGVVIVSFVVSASGEVNQVTVLKDLGGGTGEEAVRVVSKMPRWKPGVQNHRQVPVRMTLPIRFKLG